MPYDSALLLFAALAFLTAGPYEERLPPVGTIDFYGLRRISAAEARRALALKEGDDLTSSEDALRRKLQDAQRQLETSLGVAQARLELVCCEADRLIVYVGIVESGTAAVAESPAAPQGGVRLAEDVVQAGRAFEVALRSAAERGDTSEDHSSGQALSRDPGLRAAEDRFVTIAERDPQRLRDVLHHSADADHRALAAQILGYAPNKREIVGDLVDAAQDPAAAVRNNAMRALWVMADLANRSPGLGIHIPAGPFVRLLNSIQWSDRNKASVALLSLTEARDEGVLSALCAEEEAIPALGEMARWKASGHALPAFFILGRLAGLPEEQIEAAWTRGDREAVIASATACAKTLAPSAPPP